MKASSGGGPSPGGGAILLDNITETARAVLATAAGSTLMEKRPLVNMDMKTFAAWTSTEPKTCLETSKNQILTGRWGLSRHLL